MSSGVRLGSAQAEIKKGDGQVEGRKARKRGNGKGAPVGVLVFRATYYVNCQGGAWGWGVVSPSQDHSYGEA